MDSSHKHINKFSFASLLITMGIIYGDIGTSPLYVMRELVKEGGGVVGADLILGGLSCIFWTITIQTTLKYIVITLRADNNGEGGIFSLYALVRRHRKWLYIPALIGGCALLADGFISPPISVSSAIEGLKMVNPTITNSQTVPMVIIIITGIFSFQRWGTNLVGRTYGPVMLIWFSMLATAGGYQLLHHPEVLKAVNPWYAYQLLSAYPNGFWLLGAVFLCTTGAESMYSDLGHCGRINIRITWVFVKSSLLLNYFGQAAWLMGQEGKIVEGNPFFLIMPSWFLVSSVIIATAAAIVASQAIISGSFTLISEAMRLNFWPKVAIKYPTIHRGQLYVPSINTILWLGCIGITLYFQESGKMGAAYGLAITLTMLMTTILLTAWLLSRKKVPKVFIYSLLVIFLTIESSFLIANLSKFKHGGFVTLIIAACLFLVMYIWHKARQIQKRYIHFYDVHKYLPMMEALMEDESVPKYAANLVYLTNASFPNLIEAKIINSIFKKRPKRADVYWLLHVNVTDEPHGISYKVNTLLPGKVIRIDFNMGFRVEQKVNIYFRRAIDDLVKHNEVDITSRHESLKKFHYAGDFQFVIFERFLSYDNDLPMMEGFLLDMYFLLKKTSLPTTRAFGLDSSVVNVESVPLIITQPRSIKMTRIQ
ncbi:MAG: potassium transporter Kup [Flavobacteriaceae bacterium]|nr:potassium transporter Kup [Flavobacteriaceae bacterium]